jgi:hypothetical protein
MITVRDAMALPRYYPARQIAQTRYQENDVDGYIPKDLTLIQSDPDEELIFDLEL